MAFVPTQLITRFATLVVCLLISSPGMAAPQVPKVTDAAKKGPVLQVGYRFLEDPLPWIVKDKPLQLTEVDMAKLRGTLLRDQLEVLQRMVNYLGKGVSIPDAFREQVLSMIPNATSFEERRLLGSIAIGLNLQETKETLLAWGGEDEVFFQQVASSLAQWSPQACLAVWRQDLNGDKGSTVVCLAAQGLGEFGSAEDLAPLQAAMQRSPEPLVQLATAQAIGRLQTSGLEAQAAKLMESPVASPLTAEGNLLALGSQLAIALLSHHESAEAKAILSGLVGKASQAIGAKALDALGVLSGEPPTELAIQHLRDEDPEMRAACLRIIRKGLNGTFIETLTECLKDPIPRLRREAASQLVLLGTTDKSNVATSVLKVLDSNDPLAMEQACLILAEIQHGPALARISRLVEHPSPDVYVTASWAVRSLSSKEVHAQQVMKKAEGLALQMIERIRSGNVTDHEFHRLAHLIETAGELRLKSASETLMRLVPRDRWRSRPAVPLFGLWVGSMKMIPTGPGEAHWEDRMMDFEGAEPENVWVRYASTIALAVLGIKIR